MYGIFNGALTHDSLVSILLTVSVCLSVCLVTRLSQ